MNASHCCCLCTGLMQLPLASRHLMVSWHSSSGSTAIPLDCARGGFSSHLHRPDASTAHFGQLAGTSALAGRGALYFAGPFEVGLPGASGAAGPLLDEFASGLPIFRAPGDCLCRLARGLDFRPAHDIAPAAPAGSHRNINEAARALRHMCFRCRELLSFVIRLLA